MANREQKGNREKKKPKKGKAKGRSGDLLLRCAIHCAGRQEEVRRASSVGPRGSGEGQAAGWHR